MSQGCSLWPWVLEQWTLSHHWFVNGVHMSQGSCKCKYDTFCRWGPERDVAFQRLWVWNGSIIRALWDFSRFSIFNYLLILIVYYHDTHIHTRIIIHLFIYALFFSIYLYYLRKIDMHIQVYEILLYNHKLPINCWGFLHLISLFATEIKAAWVDHSAFSCFAVLGLETSLELLNRFILTCQPLIRCRPSKSLETVAECFVCLRHIFWSQQVTTMILVILVRGSGPTFDFDDLQLWLLNIFRPSFLAFPKLWGKLAARWELVCSSDSRLELSQSVQKSTCLLTLSEDPHGHL